MHTNSNSLDGLVRSAVDVGNLSVRFVTQSLIPNEQRPERYRVDLNDVKEVDNLSYAMHFSADIVAPIAFGVGAWYTDYKALAVAAGVTAANFVYHLALTGWSTVRSEEPSLAAYPYAPSNFISDGVYYALQGVKKFISR